MVDKSNVYAAEPLATGSCLVAPLGTQGPDSAIDELDEEFIDLGAIGEDGFTETTDRNIDKKRSFGGTVVKVLQTEYTHTFKFVLLESLSADVLSAVHGRDNVSVIEATESHGPQVKVTKNSRRLPHMSWVIDTLDSALNAFYRSYIPDGQITELGDVTVVHSDTISYEVTVEAFEDDAGNHVYTYTESGEATESP